MKYLHYFDEEQHREGGDKQRVSFYIVEASELQEIERKALVQDINDAISSTKAFIKEINTKREAEKKAPFEMPKFELEEKPMRVRFVASLQSGNAEILNKLEEYLRSAGWGKRY